jgi:HK97 family phage prohead protease
MMTAVTQKISSRAARRGREQRREAVPTITVRSDGSADDLTLTGYACVTNVGYEITDFFGDYTEIVRSGAFKDPLANGDDVRLLLNHDGIALARTKSNTMQLREITNPKDDPLGRGTTGLWVEASLDPQSAVVSSIRSAMSRGDIDEMSFAFQVLEQEWSPDYTQRDISSVKLFDVSVVTYPANPSTSAAIRNLTDVIDDFASRSAEEIDEAIARLQKLRSTLIPRPISLFEADADLVRLRGAQHSK